MNLPQIRMCISAHLFAHVWTWVHVWMKKKIFHELQELSKEDIAINIPLFSILMCRTCHNSVWRSILNYKQKLNKLLNCFLSNQELKDHKVPYTHPNLAFFRSQNGWQTLTDIHAQGRCLLDLRVNMLDCGHWNKRVRTQVALLHSFSD